MQPDGAVNLGSLIRNGIRLSTAEVVSVLYEACKQLEAGIAKALPHHPDDLWVTETGTVALAASDALPNPRSDVASLLETLLPQTSDESAYDVPPPLRTLPARLRESGTASGADYKDLLAILARFLPADPRTLLEQLVRRHVAGTPVIEEPTDVLVTAAPATTATKSATPISPEAARRKRWLAPMTAAAILLMLASGYVGYRFSRSNGEVDATTSTPASETRQTPPASRIVVVPPAASGSSAISGNPVAARPLLLDAPDGAFSPFFASENTLLFHTGRVSSGRMLSTTIGGDGRASTAVALVDDDAKNYHPRLSPDGRQLAFDSDRDGERGVYVSRRDGGGRRRVSGNGYAAVPSWSPDGRQLAFIKGEPERPRVWNLWILDVASGNLRRLSAFSSGQVWGASWFPDGKSVAYSHQDQLLTADLTTGITTNAPSPIAGGLVRTPAVSPDGRRIVFQVFRDGGWLFDVATGRMRRILDDPTAEEFAWEPGGRHVAYHSRRDGQWRIWVMTI
jgi:Tol biopolymer transport system component